MFHDYRSDCLSRLHEQVTKVMSFKITWAGDKGKLFEFVITRIQTYSLNVSLRCEPGVSHLKCSKTGQSWVVHTQLGQVENHPPATPVTVLDLASMPILDLAILNVLIGPYGQTVLAILLDLLPQLGQSVWLVQWTGVSVLIFSL